MVERLNAINQQFYETVADAFDGTRSSAWAGWEKLLPWLEGLPSPLRVLDVGCGNGRFGVFLAQHGLKVHYTGYDNSAALLAHAHARLREVSLASLVLTHRDSLLQPLPEGHYDLVGVFGLLHHVPGNAQRLAFVRDLATHVAPGGLLAYASWRFLDDPRFRERVIPWSEELRDAVQTNDMLLDWRQGTTALRYCHHVDDDEQQALDVATGLTAVERYAADGRSGRMNVYSVLRADPA